MIPCLSICKIAALKSSLHNFNICLILVLISVEYLLLVNGVAPFPPVAGFQGDGAGRTTAPEAGMQVEEVRGNHCGMGSRWEARGLVTRTLSLMNVVKKPLRWKRDRLHRL